MDREEPEILELDDDDLVLDEGSAGPPLRALPAPTTPSAALRAAAERRAPVPTPAVTRTFLRHGGTRRTPVIDERVADVVADECLASIAETQTRSHVRARATRAPSFDDDLAYEVAIDDAPDVDARAPAASWPDPPEPRPVAAAARPGVFARRSSLLVRGGTAPSSSPLPCVGPCASNAGDGASSSIAPVSLARAASEPTVVLVREPPKLGWVLGAGLLGAFCALAAARFVTTAEFLAPAPAAAALAPAAPPVAIPAPSAVALSAPASPVAAAAPAVTGAVIHFGDDQGVAIKAVAAPSRRAVNTASGNAAGPAVAPVAGPTTSSAASTAQALPDGSLALGRKDPPTTASTSTPKPTAAPVAAPAPGASAPEPAKKRGQVLTPEQQLAEAQLKASMR